MASVLAFSGERPAERSEEAWSSVRPLHFYFGPGPVFRCLAADYEALVRDAGADPLAASAVPVP
jgi:hypothetical protein